MKTGGILVVDDNKNILSALRILLQSHFERVELISTPNLITSKLKEFQPDIVLLDMNFSAGINSGNEGLFWLSEIKKVNSKLPVVLFTAYANIDLAVEALKRGASDFIVKPWDNQKLIATLKAAIQPEKSTPKKQGGENEDRLFWGSSQAIQQMLLLVEKVAKTNANILITGENGTGKEQVAREIHRRSLRAGKEMLTVDMGAITETLFESELFGHAKGSFTGATTDRIGKFEAATDGTLFLDEIANLSYPSQAKLLTALQSRRIVRVGENKPIPVDIRLICATNRKLEQMVADGEFREDLLYRINTIHIEVPALRDRKEDIVPLAQFFLGSYAKKYDKSGLHFSPQAATALENYAFPGNIRELQHAIEKAVILCDGNELQASDFYIRGSEPLGQKSSSLENLSLVDAERILIANALKKHDGNLSAIAAELGITRPTLYSKMKKYGL